MEVTQMEMKFAEQVVTDAKEAAMTELASLELALVGGGCVNVIFG